MSKIMDVNQDIADGAWKPKYEGTPEEIEHIWEPYGDLLARFSLAYADNISARDPSKTKHDAILRAGYFAALVVGALRTFFPSAEVDPAERLTAPALAGMLERFVESKSEEDLLRVMSHITRIQNKILRRSLGPMRRLSTPWVEFDGDEGPPAIYPYRLTDPVTGDLLPPRTPRSEGDLTFTEIPLRRPVRRLDGDGGGHGT
jgi:hypothetical protein